MPYPSPPGMPPYIIIDHPTPGKVRKCFFNPSTNEYDNCSVVDEDSVHKRIMTESKRAWGAVWKYSTPGSD